MTILIQASNIGTDAGPFDLFSDATGFTNAFETGVTGSQLLLGFVSYNVPDGTTTVRILSTSEDCKNYEDIDIIVVPDCPTEALVFQICNSNAQIDDNFDIVLNGVTIGSVDLNQNAQVGSVFVASNDPLIITQPDFPCPLGSMQLFFFDPALLSVTNTLDMINTQNNGNDNFGTIGIRNYTIVGNQLENPCLVRDLEFDGLSGEDFNFTFAYTECCSNPPV